MINRLTLKQRRILKHLVSREIEASEDEEEFESKVEWIEYNKELEEIDKIISDTEDKSETEFMKNDN